MEIVNEEPLTKKLWLKIIVLLLLSLLFDQSNCINLYCIVGEPTARDGNGDRCLRVPT